MICCQNHANFPFRGSLCKLPSKEECLRSLLKVVVLFSLYRAVFYLCEWRPHRKDSPHICMYIYTVVLFGNWIMIGLAIYTIIGKRNMFTHGKYFNHWCLWLIIDRERSTKDAYDCLDCQNKNNLQHLSMTQTLLFYSVHLTFGYTLFIFTMGSTYNI